MCFIRFDYFSDINGKNLNGPMEFNHDLHQKVRYAGQLYVVILEEFPGLHQAKGEDEFVLHPISNDWIVHIKSPTVRKLLLVKKKDFALVEHEVTG